MSKNRPHYRIVPTPSLLEILANGRTHNDCHMAAAGLFKGPPTDPQEIKDARASRSASRALLKHRRETIPGFERHSRRCQICQRDDADMIEDFFLNWSSANWIRETFKVTGVDAIYRHARAAGLDVARRQNVRIAVEKLIEEVDHVTVTSSTVLRAVRALSCLDDNGHWTDPPSTHIVLTSKDLPAQTVTSTSSSSPLADIEPPAPNRLSYEELEPGVTHTNESAGNDSNR
ncbi:MAG: hypothetical protein WA876_07935 [Candidatus Acidiferrales bacterium]